MGTATGGSCQNSGKTISANQAEGLVAVPKKLQLCLVLV
jgi:hypothetical protein